MTVAAIKEELEAQLAEGIRSAKAEEIELIKRARVLQERKKKNEAELEGIKTKLRAHLSDSDSSTLLIDGVTAVRLSTTSTTSFDRASFTKDHPELATKYIVVTAGTRFEIK